MPLSQLKISLLKIAKFRGIPDSINIPLGHPLTLIYAANGTGKSTVCQAVEWLLTGRIEGIDDDDISCKWGSGETLVSAVCTFEGKALTLVRTLNGLQRVVDGKPQNVDTLKFLQALTPTNLAVSTRNNYAIKERANWLRGTRWLYSTALGLLIDDDHLDKREQIFADILGYGHLTPVRRNIKAYWDALPSYRGLETNLNKIALQISSTKKTINESEPSAFDEAIASTYFILNIKEGTDLEDHHRRLDAMNAALSGAEHRLASVSGLIVNLLAGLQNASVTSAEATELRRLIPQVIARKKATEELIEKSNIAVKLKKEECVEGETLLQFLEDLDRKLNNASDLYAEMNDLETPVTFDIPTSELQVVFPEIFWSTAEIYATISAVEEFSFSTEDFLTLRGKRTEIKKSLLARPRLETLTAANLQVEHDRKLHQIASENLMAATSSLDNLRRTGENFVREHSDLKNCPLCGIGQDDHETLLNLITTTIGVVEPTIVTLQEAEKKATETLVASEKELSELTKRNTQAVSLQNQLIETEKELGEIISQAPFTELTLESVDTFDMSVVDTYANRLSVARDANLLVSATRQVEKRFELPSANLTFFDRVTQASKTISDLLAHQTNIIPKLNFDLSAIETALSSERELFERESRDLQATEEKLRILLLSQSAFTNTCQTLKVSDPPSPEEISRVERQIEIKQQQLTAAREQAAIATASIKSGIAFAELARLETEHKRISDLIGEAKYRNEEAERIHGIYDSHIKQLAKSQIAPLLNPAQQLFSRMHANEVYNGIGVESEDGRLIWSGIADGITVNAGATFSQGQRQDLALSLYLSRAMSMGGMFFLDEPIAHLDDLNRVAMLDIFRVLAISEKEMSLVLTTSSDSLMRHITQKFSGPEGAALLNVVTLKGNPRTGVSVSCTGHGDF